MTSSQPEPAADRGVVYVNGQVLTVDEDFSVATAFWVRDGRFAVIGTNEQVLASAGSGAAVVDLAGRTVLPGFIDTHAHTVFRALGALAQPSLAGATSIAEIQHRIQAAAARRPPGSWIVTSPIGTPPDYFGLPEALAERHWPDRHDLDAVAPRHPVYIPTPIFWPHPAILNTSALAALGIDINTTDEPGVRIEHDPDTGQPNGVIHGLHIYNRPSHLFDRLSSLLRPPLPEPRRRVAIRRAMQQNLAVGVTTIYEGHANFATADLLALHLERALPHRVLYTKETPARLPPTELEQWVVQQAADQAANPVTSCSAHWGSRSPSTAHSSSVPRICTIPTSTLTATWETGAHR